MDEYIGLDVSLKETAVSIRVTAGAFGAERAASRTEANDADGFVHLAEIGFYKEVRARASTACSRGRWW